MAKDSIRDFSATAGSNTDIQSVNIDENCPASGINNAIRELMVDLKNVSTGAVNLETPAADSLTIGTTTNSLFNSEGTSAGLTVAGSDTSTTTIGNGGAAINIVQTDGTAGNTSGLHFSRQDTDGTPNYSGAAIVAQFPDAQATGQYPKGRLAFNTSTSANAAPSEKMRLDESGRLLINRTSSSSVNPHSKLHVKADSAVSAVTIQIATNGYAGISFLNASGSDVGSIVLNASSTAYNTSSDYRLKQGVEDMTGAIDRVKVLAPKRFQFTAEPDTTVDGFLAHEAQAVVPEAITGTKDEVDDDGNAVMQGIDQSKLVPLLTGALKEAIAKIETLETEITALKARVTALEA